MGTFKNWIKENDDPNNQTIFAGKPMTPDNPEYMAYLAQRAKKPFKPNIPATPQVPINVKPPRSGPDDPNATLQGDEPELNPTSHRELLGLYYKSPPGAWKQFYLKKIQEKDPKFKG